MPARRRLALVACLVLALAVPVGAGLVPAPPAATCGLPPPLPPCNVWASRVPLGPGNEVHVAVNPLDPRHFLVVAKDYSLGENGDCRPGGEFHVGSASYVTKDGGATWSVARVPAPYPNGGAEPSPLKYKCGSDPVAAFGPDGTAYYILLNFQYTGGRQASIAVARSPDGGVTWPASDIRVLHSSAGDDKEWGAVDAAGRVHVVWTDLSTGRIMYVRSSPAYVFEAPRILASAGAGNPAVEVAPGPGDVVWVTWRDGGAIKFTRSLDGGASFQPIRTAFTVTPYETGAAPRLPFMPQVAVDTSPSSPHAGRAYLVWPDARLGDSAIFMASSGDGGASWTAAQRVDDNLVPLRRQVMPAISVAPTGRVDIAWMDQRDGASTPSVPFVGSGDTFRVYMASSGDAGATWSVNQAVSEVPLVAQLSRHQDGSVFIGDYMGIASTADAAWPSFPGNGADRALLGLPPDKLLRADAYVAQVPGPLAVQAPAPPGVVASVVVGEAPLGSNDPAALPFLD